MLTELRHYARVAWTFLNALGYINFGVAPAIAKRALAAPQERGSVIVVGAGLAGGLPSSLSTSCSTFPGRLPCTLSEHCQHHPACIPAQLL